MLLWRVRCITGFGRVDHLSVQATSGREISVCPYSRRGLAAVVSLMASAKISDAATMLKKSPSKFLSFLFPRTGWLVLVCVLLASEGLGNVASGRTAGARDAVCASCHREIYDRYLRTPMARASGPAVDGMISVPADFVHKPSEVRYRITDGNGRVYLDYDRPATGEGRPTTRPRGAVLLYRVWHSRTNLSLSARRLLV